jgi:hypothetical protein
MRCDPYDAVCVRIVGSRRAVMRARARDRGGGAHAWDDAWIFCVVYVDGRCGRGRGRVRRRRATDGRHRVGSDRARAFVACDDDDDD